MTLQELINELNKIASEYPEMLDTLVGVQSAGKQIKFDTLADVCCAEYGDSRTNLRELGVWLVLLKS